MMRKGWIRLLGVLATTSLVVPASAQDGGDTLEVPVEGPGGNTVTVVTTPGTTSTTTGPNLGPPLADLNGHLPSGSRASTDTSASADGFDLGRGSGSNNTVRGSASGAYIVSGQYTPELHTVKRGDTLWEISKRYYGNPYNWPRIWSFNRQVQNPHWLYPGDHVRLRESSTVRAKDRRMGLRTANVSQGTVFQRNVGYVLDADHPVWGEVVGSPDDQMLLSHNDQVYIQIKKDQRVEVGQLLTLFEERKVQSRADYPFVWIRGVAKINRYNPKTGMVRARIVESHTVIERGVKAGPSDRQVDVVKPVANKKNIQAHITGALYPHEFYGQHQVVFIDKGSDDGVEIGNRFFAVTRGDEWRQTLRNAGGTADSRAITEDDRNALVEDTPDKDDPERYPAETYAELQVVRVRKKTATVLITGASREVPRGALIVAREGY